MGRVAGPDRLEPGLAVAGDRQDREEGEAFQQGYPGVGVVVDDRGGEDRRLQGRGVDGLLGQPLGAEEAGALGGGGVQGAEEDEAPHAATLRCPQQADGRQAV